MTTRRDVDDLGDMSRRAVDLAIERLERVFRSLDLSDPALARDVLLEVLPELVADYGNVAATAAAEWYEDLRARSLGGSYDAVLGDTAPREQVEGTVRSMSGKLFGDDPAALLGALTGPLQRYIQYAGRSTVARNAAHDPAKPRFARVPRGAKTCAWCSMLASRGFVYHSKKTAGEDPSDFHDDCDCQIVIEWDRHQTHIEGYDPDALYGQYLAAREASGSGDQKDIAAYMRRMFPESFTDGVHEHEV